MIKQILLAIDQLLNTLLFFLPGGMPWADETFSSRTWRLRNLQPFKFLLPVINTLFFWQENHCKEAYDSEVHRRHSPPEQRT